MYGCVTENVNLTNLKLGFLSVLLLDFISDTNAIASCYCCCCFFPLIHLFSYLSAKKVSEHLVMRIT